MRHTAALFSGSARRLSPGPRVAAIAAFMFARRGGMRFCSAPRERADTMLARFAYLGGGEHRRTRQWIQLATAPRTKCNGTA